jgi:two-component system chemotaxis response regulator CheB
MTTTRDNPGKVRVLVVDDSAFMRTALSRMIASESGFEVVATARSGPDALEKIASLDPDVVTLDVEMPGIDGVETLRRIMNQFPRPVIMVSAATERGADATFDALAAGAFDYIPKQLSPASLDIFHIRTDLVAKIQVAAQSRTSPHDLHYRKPPQSASPEPQTRNFASPPFPSTPAIVALGTSTGGPRALQQILPRLPGDLPIPILIVQHMPPGFTHPFAQRMDTLCSVKVREAIHGEVILPGVVYLAPSGLHMSIKRPASSGATICLNSIPKDSLHIPSVDVLMKSVAETYKNLAMGVIMTGMGSDGAEGMKAIHRQGGLTIGQDEASCTVYGMPRACAQLGVLTHVASLSEIPGQILQAARYRMPA